MVSTGRGRLFRRKDGKYLIYLPIDLAEDSIFPFKDFTKGSRGGNASQLLKGSFRLDDNRLTFTPLKEPMHKVTQTIVVSGVPAIEVSDTCRLFRRPDGKCLIYLSTDWIEDSQFPFKGSDSIHMKVSFDAKTRSQELIAERWIEPEPTE